MTHTVDLLLRQNGTKQCHLLNKHWCWTLC